MIDLNAFAGTIRIAIGENLPRESVAMHEAKHSDRPQNLTRAFFQNVHMIPLGTSGYVFEYGNEFLENKQPHYHILEDAEVIYKRGRATKTSKGSQDNVPIKLRDYSKVTVKTNKSGKQSIYTEYRKNVRGKRSQAKNRKYREVWDSKTKNKYYVDVTNNYINVHYHYIEKTLDNSLPFIAEDFGLKMGRVKIDKNYEIEVADIFGDIIDYESDYYVEDYFEDDYSY